MAARAGVTQASEQPAAGPGCPGMQIEIWSDVVCPWCYIGKRRFESALAAFAHADEVEVVWRSFQLDPTAPREATESIAAHLGSKYGGGADAGRQMIDRVTEVAAGEGLAFDYRRPRATPSTPTGCCTSRTPSGGSRCRAS